MLKEVAIAISSRGRKEVLLHTISQWEKHYPLAEIIVVEDNNPSPRGIAATKNICIDYLGSSGKEHCFLADDDVYPIDSEGVQRYIDLRVNHACMSFDRLYSGQRISHDVFVKYMWPDQWIYNSPCGCLLYVRRNVLLSGVRFDENYGQWGMDHKDFSMQIYKAGFTHHPFIDIPNSIKHFHSMDYFQEVEGSVPEMVRREQIKVNTQYYNKKWNVK